IWEQTGRVEAMGDVMFHIKNRDGLVLAPTHEEIITVHARQHIKSYRDMPQIWYQIQTKFRNEPRPKSGVLRGRQFTMKDAYSLDNSWEGLDESYNKHEQAYRNIYTRCGLKFFVVGASSGAMGGSASQEFMVESPFGEDTCAVCEDSGYAANIEVATSSLPGVSRLADTQSIEEFPTPGARTIDDLINKFSIPEERCAKSLVCFADGVPYLILMSGNDSLNESKLQSALKATHIRHAEESELFDLTGAHAGSIGPINLKTPLNIYADKRLENANGLVSGANRDKFHFKNIDLSRDCTISGYFDLRSIKEGELCPTGCGNGLRVVNAIEVGHIFKLGTKYSHALGATFLDETGTEHPIIMGSYGIGVERIMACFIEQSHDEKGIIFAPSIAPFDIHLLGLGMKKSEAVQNACAQLDAECKAAGFDVLFDDRDVSPGVKFNDADLLGMPMQLIVGDKNLAAGNVELKNRSTGERQIVPIEEAITSIKTMIGIS
ncbi:MAG: proline--tRNA ligase, partial [Ignavibacteriae bacterium]|nr:proline--tRNA ligase [Ignavibacteriota bacterium]